MEAQPFDVVPFELRCSLCLDLLHDPVSTPCTHVFCRLCIAQVLDARHHACPLCRTSIKCFNADAASTDVATTSLILAAIPEEVAAQRRLQAMRTVHIVVGNLYEAELGKWTMFVAVRGVDKKDASKFIEKVVYELHPSSQPQRVTAHPPNFSLCRYGRGICMVHCTVHWNRWLILPPKHVDHYLVFENDGGHTPADIDIDLRVLEDLQRKLSGPHASCSARSLSFDQTIHDTDKLEVVVGNRCRRPPAKKRGMYRWTMYVMLPGFENNLVRMIERVDYDVHSPFRSSFVARFSPHLDFTRVGWGASDVRCLIYWCAELALPPTEIIHTLVLEEGGGHTWSTLDVLPGHLKLFR